MGPTAGELLILKLALGVLGSVARPVDRLDIEREGDAP